MLAQHSSAIDPLKPCIALRRSSTNPIDLISTPRYGAAIEEGVLSRSESQWYNPTKLTGSPGYITTDAGLSPTKVHPSKPHHVRGGSIGSEIDEIKEADHIIPLQPCASDMLVPLLHRHLEMKELIESNPAHFCRLRNALGTRQFVKCLDLWTETTRAEKSDLEWLSQSQGLLRSHDNWALWCEVVGWDYQMPLLRQAMKHQATSPPESPKENVPLHSRIASGSSLAGMTINEEPEDS